MTRNRFSSIKRDFFLCLKAGFHQDAISEAIPVYTGSVLNGTQLLFQGNPSFVRVFSSHNLPSPLASLKMELYTDHPAPRPRCVPLNQVPFPSQPDSGNLLQPDSPVVFTAGFVYITSPLSPAEPGLERKRRDWRNNGHLQPPSPAQTFHISDIYWRLPPLAGLITSGTYVTFASGKLPFVGERRIDPATFLLQRNVNIYQ